MKLLFRMLPTIVLLFFIVAMAISGQSSARATKVRRVEDSGCPAASQ